MAHQESYQLLNMHCVYHVYIFFSGNTIWSEIRYAKKPDLSKFNFRKQTRFWNIYVVKGKQPPQKKNQQTNKKELIHKFEVLENYYSKPVHEKR